MVGDYRIMGGKNSVLFSVFFFFPTVFLCGLFFTLLYVRTASTGL